jgi:hypothetical protein
MLLAVSRLMICLAIVAVGMGQVFGMRTGFLCDCTGQRSSQESCKADECHPGLAHKDACGTEAALEALADHDHDSESAPQREQEHREIRETLIVTGVPPLLALPAVALVECLPSLQISGCLPRLAWLTGVAPPAPREDGSPPMPLLVARTMVRLV